MITMSNRYRLTSIDAASMQVAGSTRTGDPLFLLAHGGVRVVVSG
jgi:hypothetical protein